MMVNKVLQRANAWIETVQELAGHLERVYARTSGEVWLFDNDLKVLRDHRGAFDLLYRDMIDGCLSEQVRCVKILVRKNLFDEFFRGSGQLLRNLARLRRNRLRTIYVGCLDKVEPEVPAELGGHDPWIFYLGQDHLASPSGFVIVRPSSYPFAHEDPLENLALAWETSGKIDTLRQRLAGHPWFHRVFVEDFEVNFSSLEPVIQGNRVTRLRAVPARKEREVDRLRSKLRNRGPRPVVPPADVGIVTALPEETRAIVDQFHLRKGTLGAYEGWCETATGLGSVALLECTRTGSVYGAIAGNRLLLEWSPRIVFLVGRCGGWKEDAAGKAGEKEEEDIVEGDVVVADAIYAYEYQAVRELQGGEVGVQYDARAVPVANSLLSIARGLISENWRFAGQGYPDDWGDRRRCKAVVGAYASGAKVMKRGEVWFKEMQNALGNRKIKATEMEGEGVGEAMRDVVPPVPFLLVKGISDFADPNKSDKYNELSSRSAARFIFDLLRQPETVKVLASEAGR